MHGTLMVFFVLTTAPQAGFGNYALPIEIGAEDMAFPTLNMLSFWTTFVGLVCLIATLFVKDGPPISGWTAYPPLSAVGIRCRSWPGNGAEPLGDIDRDILRRVAVGRFELYCHYRGFTLQGHGLDAHAADGVGVADHSDS